MTLPSRSGCCRTGGSKVSVHDHADERKPRASRGLLPSGGCSSGASRDGGRKPAGERLLTLHAADLLPVETSWRGTPQSPLILLETPHRQLVPFLSVGFVALADANMLIMAATGGGKTFMAMLFLLMMARAQAADLDPGTRRLVPAAGGADGWAVHRC